jgi:2-polyprenyl-3-methyl-5-hydroxy-6-metoxy-1,4-benzoquinol methylase
MGILKRIFNALTNRNILSEMRRQNEINEIRYRDLLEILQFQPQYKPSELVNIVCEESVAIQSLDHIYPQGTAYDNTRWPKFVQTCEMHFKKISYNTLSQQNFSDKTYLSYLDLGCSGGGLVLDFAIRGHFALGLEGSDYSFKRLRAEWRTIPHNLYTCNIAKPWEIISKENGAIVQFHVISAWEVLEHLSVQELKILFYNVRRHLKNNGFFIGSISTVQDSAEKNRHVTIMDKTEWIKLFEDNSLVDLSSQTPFCYSDFPRGTGNFNSTTDYFRNSDLGFHFILGKNE